MRTGWILCVLLAVPGAAQVDVPGDCAHARAAVLRGAAGFGAPPTAARSGETDVQHYALDIEIDPTAEWLGGSNTMTVRSLMNGLSAFEFRLDDVFDITDLQVGGVAASWTRLDGATIEVTLDPPVDADEVFELYVAYDGFPDDGAGFGSIEFRQRSGADEVWTLSEPWNAYTWWPAKDDNEDKTAADLWFTVPDTMVVASNGLLQGVDDMGGGQLRYRWRTEYETADYLYCFGATNYDTFTTAWTYQLVTMPLSFYIYPEDNTEDNRNAWLNTVHMLDVFTDRYGVYPFRSEKYGMCQVGFGGGMEHQTMTSQGGFWESTTAHELAHQWWGDMITCATWHDIWLNEGFATYSEAIWEENKPGSVGEPALHDWMDYRRPSSVNGTVYCYDISSISRIFSSNYSYRKGAWVLHMLRHVVGDENFFDILAAYRAAFEYGAATTADFQGVVESVVAWDMTWFFQQWVYELGAPEYEYAWRHHVVNDRAYAEVYVHQVQSLSYPIFTMPIDIAVTIGGDTTTRIIWNDAQEEHLLFEVSSLGTPSFEFDPAPWILWTDADEVSFVEGPPKIVEVSPAPGAELEPAGVATIEVVFHKDVAIGAADITLVGDAVGPVAADFSYDSGDQTATLTPAEALLPDAYTLTVSDQVVDIAAGLALDGELTVLPSGDGSPGGDAVAEFRVYASMQPGDLNCDGLVNAFDIDPFALALADAAAYATAYPDCRRLNADMNDDGAVNAFDIDPFVLALAGG